MSFSHPRRTTKTRSTPSNGSGCPSITTTMSLRKGATFHSPSTPENEYSLPFRIPSLPRRSHTTLEDVVDAHRRRVALTLGNIDRRLTAPEDSSPSRESFHDEGAPVPEVFLNHNIGSPSTISYGPTMDGVMKSKTSEFSIGKHSLRQRPYRRILHNHASDSGLGSSIMSASEKLGAQPAHTDHHCVKSVVAASAITRSASHVSSIESLPRLSARASNRIHEHILKPLLAKSSLKDFHPIIQDCPRRIHGKEIVCLRDLEKTLIFMAPERTKTAKLYLDFCLTSIRCIQATVEFLSEREQTRPHDRPYTNGYFIDLVDQIKQYAQEVQASKEKESKGEKLGEMDANSTDEIRLHGGLTKNGKPAELVRITKDGTPISIATGKPVDTLEEDSHSALKMKRSMSEEAEGDESIMRSMARRKRSASAAELAPKCCREPGCNKEFKRPCDLTKHEKTHSRPWKCTVESCKYHAYGWPTEKERDRHENDKHSAAPALYECKFKPCPYKSKRDSNCKQHMEKAHGWTYVRSKNNGRTLNPLTNNAPSVTGALPTPQMTNMHTPSSDGNDAYTPKEEDYEMATGPEQSGIFDPYMANDNLTFPSYNNELDLFIPQSTFDFSPISDTNQSLGSSSNPSPYTMNGVSDVNTFHDPSGNNVDFSLFGDEDLYSAPVHIPVPDAATLQQVLGQLHGQEISYNCNAAPHLSPSGHGNHMLYSPTSLPEIDEGFEDFIPKINHVGQDFPLFPSSNGTNGSTSAPSGLFGELSGSNLSNINVPLSGMSAQELLDYYTAVTTQMGVPNGGMDWDLSPNYAGYNSH